MRRYYTPTQDVTLYEEFQTRQTGFDEILEVGKSEHGQYSIHSLVQFDVSSISSSIAARTFPTNTQFDLRLYFAKADRLAIDQTIYLHPVSQSWVEGQGYFYEEPYEETIGATWKLRNTGSLWATSGASYINSVSASSELTTPLQYVQFNVTSIVRSWISSSYPNYGFLMKFPTADETNQGNEGNVRLFSRNSHTVFSPTLIAKWDDQVYSTGSLTGVSSDDLTVYPLDLKPKYSVGEDVVVTVGARKQTPLKTFSSTFAEWSTQSLPTSSYYSIVDVMSREVIVPFDDYSKISVANSQNYFKFKVEKMYPNRTYKVLFKVVTSDGREQIFDNNYSFVVRV